MRRALTATAAVLLLAGCGSAGGDSAMSEAANDGGWAADVTNDAGGESGERASGFAVTPDEDQQLITEGWMTVSVDDPRGALQSAALYVERAGGRVQERSEQAATEGADASARMVVRVPQAEVTRFREHLDQLGTVGAVELSSTDVGMQVRDLDARVRALQTSVERLEELMSRAGSTSDLVNAERTLTDRQAELESMLSQRAALADRVALSTLHVEFWAEGAAPQINASGFVGGLETGWGSLVTALGTTLLVVGVVLPWLVFVGVVVLLVRLLMSRWHRRERTPAGSPAAPPQVAEPVGVGGPPPPPAPAAGPSGPTGPAGTPDAAPRG